MPIVLLTGATGYIGRRLEKVLREQPDVQLRLLVRNARKLTAKTRSCAEVVEGDTFNHEALNQALEGVDTAYYLIHSMGTGSDFSRLDRVSAENFRNAAIAQGVKKIIYLGAWGCASRPPSTWPAASKPGRSSPVGLTGSAPSGSAPG